MAERDRRLFGPSRSAPTEERLLVEANGPTGPGTKTFGIDQSFEPGARNRRPTIDVGGSEDARSIMSDEFDSLDASEKAAIRATLIRCRVLAAKIANELRNKRPEQFVDKLLLADIYTESLKL